MSENSDIVKLAIDVGYGDVKVKCKDKLIKFSSSIIKEGEYAKGLNVSTFKEQNVYEYKNCFYKVGATNSFSSIATRNFEFLLKYSPLLIHHAINLIEIDRDKPMHLITGLSLINLERNAEFYEAVSSFEVDGIKTEFVDVTLRPQGRGIFDDYEGDKSGLVFVVDIGFNTLDILAYENGAPVLGLNFADRNGANRVISSLRKCLTNDNPRLVFSEQFAKDVFVKGVASFGGQEHDYTSKIEELKKDYSEFLLGNLTSDENILSANKVIIGGGGAYLVDKDVLKREMHNIELSNEPYEFANVRGYYNG